MDAESEVRAKERDKATRERVKGEAWNLELGQVLYTKVGRVEPTADQARLIVRTLLKDHLAEHYGYSEEPKAVGLAMYRRFLFEPPARTKKGDAKHLRKTEAVIEALEAFERELKQAKNAPEVWAVLFRVIGAGLLVDLRGMTKADTEGCRFTVPYQDEWRAAVRKVLPRSFSDRSARRR